MQKKKIQYITVFIVARKKQWIIINSIFKIKSQINFEQNFFEIKIPNNKFMQKI